MDYILAIDSGGTKCSVILVQPDGTVINFGRFQEPNLTGRNHALVTKAVDAIAPEEPAELYVPFCAHAFPNAALKCTPQLRAEIMGVGEGKCAAALAGCDDALAVICGTGASVIHTKGHYSRQFDGLGPMVGDFGSAGYMGLQVIRVAARALIRRQHEDPFIRAVMDRIGADFSRFMAMELCRDDRALIASLAELASQWAEQGDPDARRILEDGAEQLALTVKDALVAEDALSGLPVVGIGGVFKSDIYWQRFCRDVAAFAPESPLIRQDVLPPVAGVVLVGMRAKLAEAEFAQFRERFLLSFEQYLAEHVSQPPPTSGFGRSSLDTQTLRPTGAVIR
jgi:N-acetylglucosamine kinase-like BadF-type ATPase